MRGTRPSETLPAIGTIENPALFFDGNHLMLAYAIAPVDGGGCAVLKFAGVIKFETLPMNVDGLGAAKVPVSAWAFTEVFHSEATMKWAALNPRFWTVSFTDVTLYVLFKAFTVLEITRSDVTPAAALLGYLKGHSAQNQSLPTPWR
jgi:F420-0:gamma-glutamyl ligase-like protein